MVDRPEARETSSPKVKISRRTLITGAVGVAGAFATGAIIGALGGSSSREGAWAASKSSSAPRPSENLVTHPTERPTLVPVSQKTPIATETVVVKEEPPLKTADITPVAEERFQEQIGGVEEVTLFPDNVRVVEERAGDVDKKPPEKNQAEKEADNWIRFTLDVYSDKLTLGEIAKAMATTQEEIAKLSGIKATDKLQVSQKLTIPRAANYNYYIFDWYSDPKCTPESHRGMSKMPYLSTEPVEGKCWEFIDNGDSQGFVILRPFVPTELSESPRSPQTF